MNDFSAQDYWEAKARKALVEILRAMLNKKLSFIEGSRIVNGYRFLIGDVQDLDPDFVPFVLIDSETDHLPGEAQRHLWSPEALARLEPEFQATEIWAESFAPAACEKLIARFDLDEELVKTVRIN